MKSDELQFSVLTPSLFVMASPGLYFFFQEIGGLNFIYNWRLLIIMLPLALFIWRYLRITLLMLLCRPALVLTEESITIIERGYTIYWKDMIDVYMVHSGSPQGGGRAILTEYVIIKVRDPEKYLKAIKNPLTRFYRRNTRKLWSDSPFEVNLFLVRGDDEEIYQLVLKYYQNLRGF